MKWLYGASIILFIIPVQTLLMGQVQLWGVKPDLALVLTYFLGWAVGEVNGLLWGSTLGGLIDLFSIGTLGVNVLLKAMIGFFSGLLGRSIFKPVFWVHAAILSGISLIHDLLGEFVLHREAWPPPFEEILVRGFYNGLLILLLFFLFSNRIKGRIADERDAPS